jgi:RNA polymerase sigma-70 factor (ECF subfamily)
VADGSRTFETDPQDRALRLAAVYRSHAPYVFRVLRHIGVTDRDLDDAVQETFLVVHRRLDEFEGRASLRTWLYAVAVRVASTQRRSERREVARREVAGAGVHADGAVDPEAELARAEAADLLEALLSELDLPKRTVFVLAEIEGVRVPEISKILGVNVHTVHSRLRLAREAFEAAVRRLQAREQGRAHRSTLRSRALLERAANDDVSVARRRAAFAALALRIDGGAAPALTGWQSISIAVPSLVPAFAAGVVGTVAAVVLGSTIVAPQTAAVPRTEVVTTAPAREQASTMPSPAVLPSPALLPSAAASGMFASSPNAAVAPNPVVSPMGDAPTPSPIATASTADGRAKPRSAAAAIEPAPTSTLAAQTALLSEALAALRRGDATAALVALDRFDEEFPDGELRHSAIKARRQAMCRGGDAASC